METETDKMNDREHHKDKKLRKQKPSIVVDRRSQLLMLKQVKATTSQKYNWRGGVNGIIQ